jgi:tetraprenyl-beta-curcumene synthase
VSSRGVGSDRVASAAVFARATQKYWMRVFPAVAHELGRWRERAHEIPDPTLRARAMEGLAKRGNMEGAAAFATFALPARRRAVVRGAVAFQSACNYLDALSEQPNAAPSQNGRRLHQSLLAALDPGALPGDYYEHDSRGGRGDGGYLAALVEACHEALRKLPSYAVVAPAALRAAERVVCFQALNADPCPERKAMERWARTHTNLETDLCWWEIAASAGSSLGVHAMIATAADPSIDPRRVLALEQVYFPWVGALHTMLDHLVDRVEDARTGQHNLIDRYESPKHAAERMRLLAERALACARTLSPPHRHELIVATMASFYLSDRQAVTSEMRPIAVEVLEVFGSLARPPLAIFNARQTAERVYYACRAHAHRDTAVERVPLAAGHR